MRGTPKVSQMTERPMNGSVRNSDENPSGQRAFARRRHQLMFKKWSQAIHD
jgi:hypothetical protein